MIEENKEEWRFIPIPENEKYQASRLGQIRNKSTKRILKKHIAESGYEKITLCLQKKPRTHLVHRLVALAFILNPNDFPQVNHKDKNRVNNRVENLEWITQSMNQKHSYETERNQYKRAVWRRDPEGNEVIFDSITEAAELTSCYQSNISACLRGITNTCADYTWGYVEETIKEEPRKDINWMEIKDYPKYLIYNNGQIYTKKRNHYLTPRMNNGYYTVTLCNNNGRRNHRVHILVAHFCDNPHNKPIVNHKDGNKLNNHYTNLEWVTRSENSRHAHSLGLIKKVSKRVHQYAREDKDKLKPIYIFNSLREAAESVKFKSTGVISTILSKISMVCTGKSNTAYGYRWEYEEIK